MKIKFIPKKDRELIKANKEKNEDEIVKNHLIQEQKHRPNQIIPETNDKPMINEHLIGFGEKEDRGEVRQRSRDNRVRVQLSKQQQKERQDFKSQYLGLIKAAQSKRHSQKYKNTINFEWDKSDDTSAGYLNKVAADATKKFHQNRQSHLMEIEQKTWKDKNYEEMTDRDWRIFREDNQIYIKGGRVPFPFRDWHELQGLNNTLIHNLLNLKFQKPKPIQMQAIPIGLMKRDLMAIAPTGEGKTLAYLIPILQFVMPLERIHGPNSDRGPYAIVLVPSRELAEQIEEEFIKISKSLNITAFTAVGGRQIDLQAMALEKGCEILIGTPGRVKELLEKHFLSLERLSWVVIDEADKMISENLVEEVEFILQNSGSKDNTLLEDNPRGRVMNLFSATMVPQIEKLGKTYLANNSSYITIGQPGGGKKEIEQHVQIVDEFNKMDRLGKILKNLPGPIIIFVNQREKCQKLMRKIDERWNRTVQDYHGGKNQEMRQKIIANFRANKFQILIATDLAGRGLDVKGINAVINYDAPKNISEFIHRTGRTGRAGMKGKAFTFLTGDDQAIFYDIRVFFERNGFDIPESLKQHPAALVRQGQVASVPRRKQIVYTN